METIEVDVNAINLKFDVDQEIWNNLNKNEKEEYVIQHIKDHCILNIDDITIKTR